MWRRGVGTENVWQGCKQISTVCYIICGEKCSWRVLVIFINSENTTVIIFSQIPKLPGQIRFTFLVLTWKFFFWEEIIFQLQIFLLALDVSHRDMACASWDFSELLVRLDWAILAENQKAPFSRLNPSWLRLSRVNL